MRKTGSSCNFIQENNTFRLRFSKYHIKQELLQYLTNALKGIGLALDTFEEVICYKGDMLQIRKPTNEVRSQSDPKWYAPFRHPKRNPYTN